MLQLLDLGLHQPLALASRAQAVAALILLHPIKAQIGNILLHVKLSRRNYGN
jgi:hypothetical protein